MSNVSSVEVTPQLPSAHALNPDRGGIPCIPSVFLLRMKSWQQFFHRRIQKTLLSSKRVTPKVTPIITKKPVQKLSLQQKILPHRVNCTLSEKEYKTLQKFSRSLNIPPTKLLKNLAVAHLEERRIFSPSGEKILQGLVLEIRKIGTNINQIAKHANTFQKLGFSDLHQAHKKLDDLEKILHQAIVFYSNNKH